MKRSIFILSACVVSTLGLLAADQRPVKDIRAVLSREEFTRSGLNKLSEDELVQLSGSLFGWFEEASTDATTGQTGKVTLLQEKAFGEELIPEKQKEKKENEPDSIRLKIPGRFSGWDGKTYFRLDNGQVWKQVDNQTFYVNIKDPEVEISKGMFGTYFLSVVNYGSKCKVKRVK